MEYREAAVNGHDLQALGLQNQQALAPGGRQRRIAYALCLLPMIFADGSVVLGGIVFPLSLLGDAHCIDVVFRLVNMAEDELRRAQGYLMLGRYAAKQDQ